MQRGILVLISYEPLWETMREKEVTTYALINQYGFSANTINRLKHGKSITMFTLESLCKALRCTPNEIIEFLDD